MRHAPNSEVPPRGEERALVLFSGGQDSTVCLAWALQRYATVETIGFDYGQRHRVELAQRLVVLERLRQMLPRDGPQSGAGHLGVAQLGALHSGAAHLGPDHVLDLGILGRISESALTEERAIVLQANGLPSTFVPGRNLAFLVFAAALAYRRAIRVLVGGMCETDYSGYPDCRDATIRAMQAALGLGLGEPVRIQTPLMWRDKAQIWALADELGGAPLVDLVVEHTHTCYLGRRDLRHPWGYGCGTCPACVLRAAGWERWRSGAVPAVAAP